MPRTEFTRDLSYRSYHKSVVSGNEMWKKMERQKVSDTDRRVEIESTVLEKRNQDISIIKERQIFESSEEYCNRL